jgi:hypothetical protein
MNVIDVTLSGNKSIMGFACVAGRFCGGRCIRRGGCGGFSIDIRRLGDWLLRRKTFFM